MQAEFINSLSFLISFYYFTLLFFKKYNYAIYARCLY